MSTSQTRIVQVALKVERAKRHLGELEVQTRAFLDTKPYSVGARHHPESRKLIYYVASAESTPAWLPLIAGDVIQNLMTGLDHLAYQLVCSDTQDNPPNPRGIYFPIADDVEKYNASKARKMEGATEGTLLAIDELKPYRGGNDSLWMLHRLNSIEKHRTLLTVGSYAAGVNLAQVMARHASGFPSEARAMLKSMPAFFAAADKGFPLKAGFELYIGTVDERPDPEQQFQFGVGLSEPEIVESASLIETLRQLLAAVEGVVTALAPRLK